MKPNPFQASQKYLGPPAITVLVVAGLANPDYLIEIDTGLIKKLKI